MIMDINFTKNEYRALLEMLYLADWMMHAQSVRNDKRNQYEELKRKILSHYKEMMADDVVEYIQEEDEYYENKAFQESLHTTYIDKYEDNVFWGELIEKLAIRDVINEIGVEQFQALPAVERFTKIDHKKNCYMDEFEQHGVKRVAIDKTDPVN
jgi:hypothetical protein